jgi:hypothetical protein
MLIAVFRQVFWLSRPLPAFPFENEQWRTAGKGFFNRDYSGGTAPASQDSLLSLMAPETKDSFTEKQLKKQ